MASRRFASVNAPATHSRIRFSQRIIGFYLKLNADILPWVILQVMDSAAHVEYRRDARRLRNRLSARPAEMHRQLRELGSKRHVDEAEGKSRLFTCFAAGAMQDGLMRYSKRQ